MNRKAFILPLVLLILALMSGIAVVLGRLSSEKTLSLKNQEGSYYAKEITVTLVNSGTEEDNESIIYELIDTLTLEDDKESKEEKIEWKDTDIPEGNYNISVKIESENDMDSENTYTIKKNKNKTETITETVEIENVSAEKEDLTFEKISDDGTEINYTGIVEVGKDGKLKIEIEYTNTTENDITADITVTLTEILKD
jgi:hypothetical protein